MLMIVGMSIEAHFWEAKSVSAPNQTAFWDSQTGSCRM